MKNNSRREIILLFLLNFLVRLPFLWAGYGREEDAWAQVLNAREIWSSGVYEVSRLPGHPIYELLLSLLWPIDHSPLLYNSISALASSLAVVFFYKICKRLNLLNVLALCIGFTFIPVFFIAGTYTIDYNIGLLFVLISFHQLLKGNYWLSGILLGLATGVRISHLGFILPWLILIFTRTQKIRPILKTGIAAVVTAVVSFLPPILQYGSEFLDFHKPPFPPLSLLLYKMSIGIWGIPLIVFLVYFFFTNIRRSFSFWTLHSYYSRMPRGYFISLILIFVIQLGVFLRLPFKSEFFLPFIPFFIMYLGALFSRTSALLFAGASLISTFLLGFDYKDKYRGGDPGPLSLEFAAASKEIFLDPLQGPALLDHSKRKTKSELVDSYIQWQENIEKPTYVIAGWYWPEIMVKEAGNERVKLIYYADSTQLMEAHSAGMQIFYLPEINEANAKVKAHYLADSLGTPWRPRNEDEDRP